MHRLLFGIFHLAFSILYLNQVQVLFNGKEQGFNRLNDEIDHVDFNDSSAILHFTNNINTLLLSDVRDNMNNQERDIESQLKKGHTKQELYDYIYQFRLYTAIFSINDGG